MKDFRVIGAAGAFMMAAVVRFHVEHFATYYL